MRIPYVKRISFELWQNALVGTELDGSGMCQSDCIPTFVRALPIPRRFPAQDVLEFSDALVTQRYQHFSKIAD